jgi:CubicO group peptidase (beta-lactamase class C family)
MLLQQLLKASNVLSWRFRRGSSVCGLSMLLFLVQPQWVSGKTLNADEAAAVDKAVEAEIERQQIVGVAIGIVQNGDIVYVKGYGLADRERRKRVDLDTVFNWASNSKPLAAVAAVQLVEEDLLDLDADVRDYVPEFPDKGVIITTRHLLCHQSGIPHYDNGEVIRSDQNTRRRLDLMDPVDALERFKQSPLLYNPGEQTSYSSFAFVLLSAVIQSAGKQSFRKQIDTRIAEPLGLKSLQLDIEKPRHNWAVGYVKTENGDIMRSKDQAHYWKHGAGGYKSNIQDFVRWAQALINRELLNEDGEALLTATQATADGAASVWGLGIKVSRTNGQLLLTHGGLQDDSTTHLEIYPEKKYGIVTMSNARYASHPQLARAVFEALNCEQQTTEDFSTLEAAQD